MPCWKLPELYPTCTVQPDFNAYGHTKGVKVKYSTGPIGYCNTMTSMNRPSSLSKKKKNIPVALLHAAANPQPCNIDLITAYKSLLLIISTRSPSAGYIERLIIYKVTVMYIWPGGLQSRFISMLQITYLEGPCNHNSSPPYRIVYCTVLITNAMLSDESIPFSKCFFTRTIDQERVGCFSQHLWDAQSSTGGQESYKSHAHTHI